MTSSNDSDFCFQGIEKPKYDNNPAILNNFNNNIEEEDSLDFEEKYKQALKQGDVLFKQKLGELKNKMINKSVKDFSKEKQTLPLARIKRIMKVDKNVRMISSETSSVFSKACELFIIELACKSFQIAVKNKRRTIQQSDIKKIVHSSDNLDFLLDIVEESYKRNFRRYAEEFFSSNLDHEKLINKMYFPDFKNNNESSNSYGQKCLQNNSSSNGILQMYSDHYKRFQENNNKK